MSKNFRNYLIQYLLWLMYYGLEFYIEILNHIFTKTSIIRYLLGVLTFYICLIVLKFSPQIFRISLIIFIFLLFILFSLCIKYETVNLFHEFANPSISVQILYEIDNFAKLFGVALVYSTYLQILEDQKQAIAFENELFTIETNYLNTKIDTHFFLNSLNIFYSPYLKGNSEAAQKLLELSNFVKKNLK